LFLMSDPGIKQLKMRIRRKVWDTLERLDIASFPRPVHGRIPNFKGADKAANLLIMLKEWQSATVVKSNPDSPQYHLRFHALREGKLLIMATPRLLNGFLLLDPKTIPSSKYTQAATISGAFKYGKIVELSQIPRVDLIVTGCVAVDKRGVRLGKGGGFAELEYGILRELGVIDDNTLILTTIHDLQLIDEDIPLEKHDLTIDYYATPTRLVKVESQFKHRPRGILWELLTPQLRELRVIRELAEITRRGKQ